MAKLTEKQLKVLQHTLKHGRIHIHDAIMSVGRGSNLPGTIDALVKRGYLKEDYPSFYYLLTDDGYNAAIAANVSADAATDAWIIENAGADGAELSEPAPDAAQTGDAVTVASIQAALDAIEWTDADSGSGIFAKVEQLSDGIGCEWFFKDTGRFLDFEGLGKTPEDAMRKVKTMIDTDDRKVDPRDAEKAALERELEAVKQMFDGYQAAARETEQAAQRDLEAARTEAAALREALAEMPKYRLGQEVSVGEYSPAIGKVEEIRITDDGIDYSVYVEGESMAYTWSEGKVSPADPDAALAAARQRADSGARTSADDVGVRHNDWQPCI
jgi:hypothetical protein